MMLTLATTAGFSNLSVSPPFPYPPPQPKQEAATIIVAFQDSGTSGLYSYPEDKRDASVYHILLYV